MQKAIKAAEDYFRGAIAEMKKVVWPNKKQTLRYTLVVVAMSIGVAVFFSALDYFFTIGLELLIR